MAQFATCDEYWEDGADDNNNPEDYKSVPIAAIHLLAKMKHYRAQLAINTAILGHHEETGDWLTEDMPHVLAYMGVGAIRTLTALMQYRDTDRFVRIGAATALITIAGNNPEEKPGIVASIKDAALHEDDINTRTLLVDTLVDLKDPDLLAYLKNSLETNFITNDYFHLEDIDGTYADLLHTRCIDNVDPLYIFEYRDDNPYKQKSDDSIRTGSHTAQKIGRNDPCPCGSGKKYKKCCLSLA